MPENEFAKIKTHPGKRPPREDAPTPNRPTTGPAYAELSITSNYTFLTGASHPEELIEQAAALGHRAAAITDTNTLAGIVRAHVAAKETGIPLIVGCRLELGEHPDIPSRGAAPECGPGRKPWVSTTEQSQAPEGRQSSASPPETRDPLTNHISLPLLLYPTSRPAYARLCRLLTTGKRRAPKGECHLTLRDVLEHAEGMLAIAIPPDHPEDNFTATLRSLKEAFDNDRLSLEISRTYLPDDASRIAAIARLSSKTGIPLVATNTVHYHIPERRQLQDVLSCIRHGCTIAEAGFRLHANAERHLKPPDEMVRLFAEHPRAISRTVEIAERAAFNLDELKYQYPTEPCPDGMTPFQYLVDRTMNGAAKRYPAGIPEKTRNALDYELRLIEELHYEPYFLTCYDIVTFARSKGILCQGRGGAANSAVCYCLGITEVDPARFSLLFERFISRARAEPPDIDIDFEHERREEVIQYLYQKYGRDRAALTAEVISYRGRSAIREVGKAMGLSLDCVDTLARHLDRWHSKPNPDHFREAGLDPDDVTIRQVLLLTRQLVGFPRHLSQHVGGFVITRTPLCDLVPIENAAMEDRTVIEWDKDDIDAMGMLKIDVLGLGMLTCIRKAFELVEQHTGETLSIPKVFTEYAEDSRVYQMLHRADTIGVFQIESRAQMSMLPRLKPVEFYDLVIEVAIVRPGPIQGGMVHPYLRRRSNKEKVSYPQPEIEAVLSRTLGVPLFQEQAMQIAIVAGGFTPDEADQLRRAMAAWRRKGDKMLRFGEKLIAGMLKNGYPLDFAERCFEQIKGFSEYGFPESHAASFAILVYASCWLKRFHPAAFASALINSQPMGFYQPAQIIRDAREHGVPVRPIDVNHSTWDCTLEQADCTCAPTDDPATWGRAGPAIRLGMRLVSGLKQADADRIAAATAHHGPFDSIIALQRAGNISVGGLRRLARADAFASMGLDRQAALWQVRNLRDEYLPLLDAAEPHEEEPPPLPPLDLSDHVLRDYASTSLSLKAHPVSFLRPHLDDKRVTPNADLRSPHLCPQGRTVSVAGAVLVRQRPGTASGVVFITLEDETGIANLVIWSDTFEKYRKAARLSAVLLVRGRVERQGEVVHIHADRIESLDHLMPALEAQSRDFH